MAKQTDSNLQNQIIYSVYVRCHTKEGTFAAVEGDLERIKKLGTDIIWFLPIHPIGEEGKKGTLGCPYANKDYRTTNPCYGTMEEFKHLVDEIHAQGMKCMIDVVYNHTALDATLVTEHPEFYYRDEKGNFGNKIGDWADVIDLDYTNRKLWEYQAKSLAMWAELVDGFRCDVASFVPLEFWKYARAEVEKVNPDCIWLAETVHRSFGAYARREGFYSMRDTEAYEAFDLEYEYDIREEFEAYLKGETPLSHYADLLNFQESVYPENYNKLRFLENHDTKRIYELIPKEQSLINLTAMLFYLKGTTLIYAGQEFVNDHTPSLFEKEPIDRNTGRDLSNLFARLSEVKHQNLGAQDCFWAEAMDVENILIGTRENKKRKKKTVGIFSLLGNTANVKVPLSDGAYVNLIDGRPVMVFAGMVLCKGWPIILEEKA